MTTWLRSLPNPLALFVANDLWGFELLQAAREIGLAVPEDVAILGVDNEELLCEISHPPLSSIRIGAEQIGRVAVSLLDELLRKKRKILDIPRVPPIEVVTRQSTDVLAVDDADVAAALRHIRQHAVEGLSVKQLLEAVPVNRRTLERRFVSVLGHTPLEEIRRIRLDRAKVLLQTDLPIYDVAPPLRLRHPRIHGHHIPPSHRHNPHQLSKTIHTPPPLAATSAGVIRTSRSSNLVTPTFFRRKLFSKNVEGLFAVGIRVTVL